MFDKILKKYYNPYFPRGISKGEKYFQLLKILKKLKVETKIKNFAVLDCVIWRKKEEKI
jgi:hypothetical protein